MHGLEELEPEEDTGNDNNGNKELDQVTWVRVHLHQRRKHDQCVKEALEYESEQPVRISNRVPIRLDREREKNKYFLLYARLGASKMSKRSKDKLYHL